jgi:hypothetical protein
MATEGRPRLSGRSVRMGSMPLPDGTDAGPTEVGVCFRLTRLKRHFGVMPHMDMTAAKWGTSGRRGRHRQVASS